MYIIPRRSCLSLSVSLFQVADSTTVADYVYFNPGPAGCVGKPLAILGGFRIELMHERARLTTYPLQNFA